MVDNIQKFSPDKIQNQPVAIAPFVMVYAPNGHGKTSFALSAGNPFVIDTEDKYQQTTVNRYVPNTLLNVIECMEYLYNCEKFPGNILVIDTLDWLEKRIHEQMCQFYKTKDGTKVSNINEATHEQLNFGKGSKIAANEFNAYILTGLESIRRKHNVPILLCAHASKIPVNLPDRDKHDIIDLRLDKALAGYISDRVEAKMYIQMRFFKDVKGKVHPTDERFLITKPQMGIAAKNSLHLPDEINIGEYTGWNDFVSVIGANKQSGS